MDQSISKQWRISDLGLHCLPMSHKKNARLIWVNPYHVEYLYVLHFSLFFYPVNLKCLGSAVAQWYRRAAACLGLVQHRKTGSDVTERLLTGT